MNSVDNSNRRLKYARAVSSSLLFMIMCGLLVFAPLLKRGMKAGSHIKLEDISHWISSRF